MIEKYKAQKGDWLNANYIAEKFTEIIDWCNKFEETQTSFNRNIYSRLLFDKNKIDSEVSPEEVAKEMTKEFEKRKYAGNAEGREAAEAEIIKNYEIRRKI